MLFSSYDLASFLFYRAVTNIESKFLSYLSHLILSLFPLKSYKWAISHLLQHGDFERIVHLNLPLKLWCLK